MEKKTYLKHLTFNMSLELATYLKFNPSTDDGGYDESTRLRKLVKPEELKAYRKYEKDQYFIEANEDVSSRKTTISSSGKYSLTVSSFKTKPGSWNYSQGKVYATESDNPIAIVNRNYGHFPFLFIENHPNGHDYLICGEDYQGQTVIELDTGKRTDHLPEAADDGFGFCCAKFVSFNKEHQLLLIDGCYWACPYEYKFYDFSNPLSSLNCVSCDFYIDSASRKPEIDSDGIITTYLTEYVDSDDEDEDEDDNALGEIRTITKYKKENNKFILVSEWVSDKERERRIKNEQYQKEWEEFVANYKSSDPIWLRFQELIKEEPFKPESYCSTGVTYDDWCPTWKGDEKRFCQRIYYGKGKGYTFDVEIAHLSGPIKLVQYKDGNTLDPIFFEHSVNGIEQLITYSKNKLLMKDE